MESQCHGSDVFKKEQQTLWRQLDEGDAGDIAENAFSEVDSRQCTLLRDCKLWISNAKAQISLRKCGNK